MLFNMESYNNSLALKVCLETSYDKIYIRGIEHFQFRTWDVIVPTSVSNNIYLLKDFQRALETFKTSIFSLFILWRNLKILQKL